MEGHIINIIRFATCMLTLIIAEILLVKSEDNNVMRRLSAVIAAILIYFNERIGTMIYLIMGSTIELLVTVSGIGFLLALLIVAILLPFLVVIHWLTH